MLDIKGIIPFILALAQIRGSHPDVLAIIPGIDKKPHPRDKTRNLMEKIVVENRMEETIVRVPFSDNVEQYYLAADIVVAPFVTPHFSRAVMEAGAMAKPVVGSRIGGITEVLDDGKVGLLATPGDPEDLARKICYLIENRDLAREMGRAGLIVARQRFDATANARAVMKVYDQVLGITGAAE
jgi:glycosyltransferase involved in cell wall biosynthesis